MYLYTYVYRLIDKLSKTNWTDPFVVEFTYHHMYVQRNVHVHTILTILKEI